MFALLGGTFDPPHIGHLLAAESALALPGCKRVAFLPAGDPYRKAPSAASGDAPSPVVHRVAMTRLAIAGNPAFFLDEREVHRAGPTYTADTLQELAAEGTTRPYLVLGADALADLPHWRDPNRIREAAAIVIAPRPGVDLAGCPYPVLDMPAVAISSTDIRRRVRDGLSIRYLVPEEVASYIGQHWLYRAR